MLLGKLELSNFRNISSLEITLGPKLNVFLGPNAQGKTNLLEAVHYLSTTRSFRSRRDADLVRFGEKFARLASGDIEMAIVPPDKKINLRGKPARAAEVLGVLRTVLFSPEDMNLLSGAPQARRDYLDELLSRVDRKYLLTLISYNKTLKSRNRLLWQVRERQAKESDLSTWDELLSRDGARIFKRRLEVLSKLQAELDLISPALLGGEKAHLNYTPKTMLPEKPEEIEAVLLDNLTTARPREIAVATSLVGPHRDDFEVVLGDKNIGRFGSRGEQRAAILALKLSELNFNEDEAGSRPILLLDDVLSELDEEHRAKLLAETGKQQTLLSATGEELLPAEILSSAKIFEVRSGGVKEHV